MGRWAQARKRGGGGINPTASSLPSITITPRDENDFDWDVSQPHNGATTANIYSSTVESGPYTLIDQVAWSDGTYLIGDYEFWYRVVGGLIDETPKTQPSNSLFFPTP